MVKLDSNESTNAQRPIRDAKMAEKSTEKFPGPK